MKSIREYCTKGMSLADRRELLTQVEPIAIGETVYEAGGAFEWEHPVVVTAGNQNEITMFWNSLYFDNEKDAHAVTAQYHAEYSDYQGMACYG